MTDAFLPLLRRSAIPRIVIMSSDLGSIAWTLDPSSLNHNFQEPIYKASKAAVNMLGAVFSNIYAKDGIRVNLVNPGFRSTGLNNHSDLAGPKEDGAWSRAVSSRWVRTMRRRRIQRREGAFCGSEP